MEPNQGMATSLLTDDLVVEILSWLPLKSFCRFKCVCKACLALSSHPYYRQKLPKTPAGLLHRKNDNGTGLYLTRLPSGDRGIDTSLHFVPNYEDLKLMDYSNGLLLCYYVAFKSYFAGISHVIVCNPATQEWMALPHTQPGSDDSYYDSQHFYVFKFRNRRSWEYGEHPICEIELFFSEDSAWYNSHWEHEIGFYGSTHFIRGVLYVEHLWGHCVLAMDAPDTSTQWLNQKTIKLPGFPVDPGMFDCFRGRFIFVVRT